MRRKVNRNNPKNIKCCHCDFCDFSFVLNCRKRFIKTNYWNRCMNFEWRREDGDCKD